MATPIADMVREMLARGVEADIIVLAIEAAESRASADASRDIQPSRDMSRDVTLSSADATLELRRKKDRIRQKARRNRLKAQPPDVTLSSADASRDALVVPLSIRKKEVSKEDKTEAPTKRHVTRGSRLTDEWRPRAEDQTLALELLGHSNRVLSELLKFRDHWKAAAGPTAVKRDWDAAWRNWARRASEFHGGQNGSPQGRKSVVDVARRLAEQFEMQSGNGLASDTGSLFRLPAR
jgi:hypothetical protein